MRRLLLSGLPGADHKMLRHKAMLEANAERSTSNVQRRTRFDSSVLLRTIVWNDVVPFVSRRAGDECDHRLGVAHVEDFMRHAGLDVDEIAGFVFDHLFQACSEFVAHFSIDDVENYFEPD